MTRPTVVRFAVFLATTMAAWGILTFGVESDPDETLTVGSLAQREYRVIQGGPVLDTASFEDAEEAARQGVEPVTEKRPAVEEEVFASIDAFFANIADSVQGDEPPAVTSSTTTAPPETTTTAPPDTTTTTAPPEEETTETTAPPTTIAPGEVLVTGFMFIDADGDGEYEPELAEDAEPGAIADRPLPEVGISLSSELGEARAETQSDGMFATSISEGSIEFTVNTGDPQYPDGFVVSAGQLTQSFECAAGSDCGVDSIGLDPELVSADAVVASLGPETTVDDDSIRTLAEIARADVVRTAVGESSRLTDVQLTAITLAQNLFSREIYDTAIDRGVQMSEARNLAFETVPLVFFSDARSVESEQAAADVVSNLILSNWIVNSIQTEEQATAAAEAVIADDYMVEYQTDQLIAAQGERLTQLQIDAINEVGLSAAVQEEGGLLAVLAILSGTLALYLNRFRPEFWARPRMVALLGILIVLAAGAVRGTLQLAPASSWYVLPAVAFGLMTTVLFDARIGVLMSLAMAILTAVGTADPGIIVYGLLATVAPIGFVSSVSTRRAFRNAAVLAAVAAAGIAAATSWFFHTGPEEALLGTIGTSVAWAFGVSLVAALVGLALLQFFESAFDITTTLALLDLTDRNHDGLQLLQEKAFGTFNHSLMVGTLADAAARAIGADPLLARASAYYHDLGKTENPTMFIENQFGIANPHNEMTPEESAEMIRRHVTDGVRLARRYKIPSEVAEAIVSHHGDGIMRYFYEKARETDPDIDPAPFRHLGHKPRTAESAIVMLADSLEASCRAVFQQEEPSPEAIEKVVNRVIDEKVNDGQLSEAPLTLAQLTAVRKAFLGSLVGHYHQRIAYPNFPGS